MNDIESSVYKNLFHVFIYGTLGGTRTRNAYDLNVVCLPIPPPGHGARGGIRTRSVSNVGDFKSPAFHQFRHSRKKCGAQGEIRTRTLWLLRPLPLPIALPGLTVLFVFVIYSFCVISKNSCAVL